MSGWEIFGLVVLVGGVIVLVAVGRFMWRLAHGDDSVLEEGGSAGRQMRGK
jgi:hypothetical protein